MCPPGYHHNGFVATDALGHIMYITWPSAWVPQSPCCDNREGKLFS